MKIMMKSTGAMLVALLCSTAAQAATGSWNVDAAGNWIDNANWVSNYVPNAAGEIAMFTNNITTTGRNITIGTTATVGSMYTGDASTSFRIIGGTLVFDNGANGASLTQRAVSKGDSITSIIALNSHLAVTNVSANTLTIGGAGDIGGFTGAGAVTINGDVTLGGHSTNNNFAAGLTLNSGKLTTINAAKPAVFGTGTLTLKSGELVLTTGGTARNYGNTTTVAGDVKITSDITGANTVKDAAMTLGTLNIGSQTLTAADGADMAAGYINVLTFTGANISGNTVLDVQNNSAGTNRLTIGTLNGTGSITKNGAGELRLNGAAGTFGGDITVSAGWLTLMANGGLQFVIGANGVNNTLAGTGTVVLNGGFTFDLSGASQTVGDSWQIVDVDNLTETFSASFAVLDFTADATSNLWTKAIDGTKSYEFSEATGVLMVVSDIPLVPATLHIAYSGGSVVVGSTNMASGFAHTLQVKNDLVYGTWSNVSTVVGVTSTNWTFSPISAGFYRIESN